MEIIDDSIELLIFRYLLSLITLHFRHFPKTEQFQQKTEIYGNRGFRVFALLRFLL